MTRTHAAFALVVAALAVLAALLMPNPPADAHTHPASSQAVLGQHSPIVRGTAVGPDLAVLTAAAPATETLTPGQADEALLAADRVCDGLTSQVPEGWMIRAVAEEQGMTLTDAHAFVEAAITRCPTR